MGLHWPFLAQQTHCPGDRPDRRQQVAELVGKGGECTAQPTLGRLLGPSCGGHCPRRQLLVGTPCPLGGTAGDVRAGPTSQPAGPESRTKQLFTTAFKQVCLLKESENSDKAFQHRTNFRDIDSVGTECWAVDALGASALSGRGAGSGRHAWSGAGSADP